jgi:hypothetical protein
MSTSGRWSGNDILEPAQMLKPRAYQTIDAGIIGISWIKVA